ncbi:MAG TPA: prolyl oligopeptidase family serine peptidase [Thermoanaerobaculia bacterium]|nr:prolyl oligopeptidase family serine peptidase [Thermoanaerobaculia bacterium]
MNLRRTATGLFLVMLAAAQPAGAQQPYQHPPREIVEILDAPAPPVPVLSPAGNALILATPVQYRPISDLAEPMIRGAGTRINPRNNGSHLFVYYVALELQQIPDGPAVALTLPAGARVTEPRWNVPGSMFAFSNVTATSVELWVGDTATAKVRRVEGVRLNPSLGYAIGWMPDQKTLLVKTVPAQRGAPPAEAGVPAGPRVEDTSGVTSASSTYEAVELLKTPHDADLFEYYTTSQAALVDPLSGNVTTIGSPAVLWKLIAAPGGQYLLVERLERPYSVRRMFNRFPAEVEVWDLTGKKVETLAVQPLAEEVPIDGVRVGPRDHAWRSTAPATVVWVEALDDGDTYKKVPHHDRVMLKPVGGEASELVRTEQRFESLKWIDQGGLALLTEEDYDKRWSKTYLLDGDRAAAPKLVWSRSVDDAYSNPGDPVYRRLPGGAAAIRVFKGAIFTAGEGASPAGSRPFLDRIDLRTLKTERLFRSSGEGVESFAGWVDPARMTFLTQRESPSNPPNIYLRALGAALPASTPAGEARFRSTARQLTRFIDSAVRLREISKRLVTYERPDGVKLSFTLYLPPGYQAGTRLPTLLWAYPLNYTDPNAAGQVVASPQTFTTIWGASPVFLALQGYAVLHDAAMPVIGPTETAYDTFLDQIVANAKAAIDKAVELGVTDRGRVGVGGHSHGALMAANLLAWSDLFRAGVAFSGAYNHTLRPFGFQNERRTLYQAPDTYLKLSPLLHADRIDAPLLIVHGERDNNAGTVPLQSEKLFEAIRGTGGTARLVMLPLEPHGYLTRESVEHTLYETLTWLDRFVKNAPPREKPASPPADGE